MGKLAFLFPGQGSQFTGMGKDFFDSDSHVRDIYQNAGEILGFDIAGISFQGPEEKLKQTQYTQPALYVHSYVVGHYLGKRGISAQGAAGHSLGEFSALCHAGALEFEKGLTLVRERARLMQHAGDKNPGSMAAIIGLSAEAVMTLCIEAGEVGVVQPANYNSPQQIVVSGSREGVNQAMVLAREKGAKIVKELPVSGAFHSPLMAGAVTEFGACLEEIPIRMATIPMYANVTARPVTTVEEIRNLLHHQLTHSVRWVETIENMIRDGFDTFVEVGAGKVLSGLVKRIDRNVRTLQCGTLEEWESFTYPE